MQGAGLFWVYVECKTTSSGSKVISYIASFKVIKEENGCERGTDLVFQISREPLDRWEEQMLRRSPSVLGPFPEVCSVISKREWRSGNNVSTRD